MEELIVYLLRWQLAPIQVHHGVIPMNNQDRGPSALLELLDIQLRKPFSLFKMHTATARIYRILFEITICEKLPLKKSDSDVDLAR